MVTVTGVAAEITASGRVVQPGVTIEAYKEGGTVAVATTTTAADGSYTLVIPTGGVAVDGYVLAKKATYLDTYLYPPGLIAADLAGASILLLTQSTLDTAALLAQSQQLAGKAFVAAMVVDPTQTAVAGATISLTPASGDIRYNKTGLPSKAATATADDGIGYVFGVTPGATTIGAAATGATFHAHPITARADVITTTLIQ